MITVIRRGMQSKLYKGFLLIIVLALAGAFSLPGIIKMAMGKTEWVININNTHIDHNDLARTVMGQQELVETFRTYYGENADLFAQLMGIALDPQVLAFDKLVRDTLLNQETQKLSIAIDEDYVLQQLRNLPFLQQEVPGLVPRYVVGPQGIDMGRLRSHLQRMGLTIADFEVRTELALARSMTLAMVQSSGYALESEIKERFIRENAGKKFTLLTVPMNFFLKVEKGKEISKQELKAFFDKKNVQEKRYWVAEKRAGIVWEFTPQNYGIVVSDEDIAKYYNDNKTRYFVESPTKISVRRLSFDNRQEAEGARQNFVTNPELFAKQAELLPAFAKNTHEREFEKAAFLLKNDGDFSAPIKTSKGFELLQRVSREPQTYKSLTSVSSEIRDILLNRLFQKRFERDGQQVKKRALQDVGAWQTFIEDKAGLRKPIELMINDNSSLAQKLFRLHKDGYSFYIAENKGFIVRLSQVQKRHLPSLASLRQVVENDIYQERAEQAMRDRFIQLKKEARSKSFQELAKDLNATVKTTGWLRQKDQEALQKLAVEGIPATQLLQLEKKGSVLELTTGQDGYLARLDEIELFDEQAFNEQKAQLRRAQTKDVRQMSQQAFVASLYRNATIKTNESYNYPQQ